MKTWEKETKLHKRSYRFPIGKKLSIIFVLTLFFLAGCSILPRITFDKPNTVPQSTKKEEKYIKCRGEITFNELGQVVSCERNFRSTEKIFNQKERKTTFKERIINFLSNLGGWLFWGFIGLLIFAPGVLGFIGGRLIEGIFGVSTKALRATVKGISKAKKSGGNFTEELRLAHASDKKVREVINKMRAEEA